MDDDLLPTPPRSHSEPQLPRAPFARLASRKRSSRADELNEDNVLSGSIHTSSDPALFSSDETPDAENYSGSKRRKKKTYAGTWWGEKLSRPRDRSQRLRSQGSSHKAAKREFTRNFDSGIFMCSEDASTEPSSDSSFGNDLMEVQERDREEKVHVALPEPVSPIRKLVMNSRSSSPQRTRGYVQAVQLDYGQQQALSVIRHCLEAGKEDVDLSGMGLESLPPELRTLATMVKDDPADQGMFDSLVARPRLYLASNQFREFPGPVLELTNLRLLSLRQNKLTCLPPTIRNLVKLETLNISGNKLHFLPSEVLDLMSHHRLTTVQSEPNPWVNQADSHICRNQHSRAGAPTHYHRDGEKDRLNYHLDLQHVASTEPTTDLITRPTSTAQSRIPPLSELVLRQLAKTNTSRHQLVSLLPDDAPSSVQRMLKELHTAQTEGDRHCSWCKRRYVMPAQRFIEFWNVKLQLDASIPSIMPSAGSAISQTKTQSLPFEFGICGGCA